MLDEVIAELSANEKHGADNQPFFEGRSFVNALWDRNDNFRGKVSLPAENSGVRRYLPNPNYRPQRVEPAGRPELAGLGTTREEIDAHWGPRGEHVVGRTTTLRALVDYLQTGRFGGEATGMLVVTGPAGSGKSAILSRLVLASDPGFAGRYPDLVTALGQVPAGLIDVAVHAQQRTTLEVALQLAEHLSIEGDLTSVDGIVNTIHSADLGSRCIVVDAIDESRDPLAMLRDLLHPLAMSSLRVLIGVRSVAGGDRRPRDAGGQLGDQHLLQLLSRYPLIDVSEDPNTTEDLSALAVHLLGVHPQARHVARLLASQAFPSFLLVRQIAGQLARDPGTDVDDARIARLVDAGVVGVLARDVINVVGHGNVEGRQKMTTLLRVAALSNGRGIPWQDLWTQLAGAIDPTGLTYTDGDVQRLATSTLRAHLRVGLEHDVTVYRPSHEKIREVLTDEPDKVAAGETGGEPEVRWPDPAEAHAGLLQEGLRLLREGASAGDAYLRENLPLHAADADMTQALLDAVDVLPVIHRTLLPVAAQARRLSGPGQRVARALAQIGHGWTNEAPIGNAASLRLAAASTAAPSPMAWTRTPQRPVRTLPVGSHATAVVAVPDVDGGHLLASAGFGGTVQLWDPTSGEVVGRPIDHGGRVSALAVVPDGAGGRLLASAGDGGVRLWDPTSGEVVGRPIDQGGRVSALAVVPDGAGGHLLASAGDAGTVKLWDPTSRKAVGRPIAHGTPVSALAVVADGAGRHLLASAGDAGTVKLWDLTSRKAVGRPIAHGGRVSALAVVPDGAGGHLLASAGNDRTVKLWDPTSGVAVGRPIDHGGRVSALAVVADRAGGHLLASAGNEGTVKLWDPTSGRVVGRPIAHGTPVSALGVVADGAGGHLLASAGNGGTVKLWDLTSGWAVGRPIAHGTPVSALGVVPDRAGGHLLASAGNGGTVKLWHPTIGEAVGRPIDHGGRLYALAVVPDRAGGHLLASAGYDGTVKLWHPTIGEAVGRPIDHGGCVNALTVVPDGAEGHLLASAGAGGVRLWDLTSRKAVGRPIAHGDYVNALTVVPDGAGGHLLASAGFGRTVKLWDPTSGEAVGRPIEHGGWVDVLAVVADGAGRHLLASAGSDGTVKLWDPTSGESVGRPIDHGGRVSALAVVADGAGGHLLASAGSGGTVRLWDPTSGAAVCSLTTTAAISSLAIWRFDRECWVAISWVDGGIGALRLDDLLTGSVGPSVGRSQRNAVR
ncbi:High-affnity carbon uptake protein Hat/HatR [Euzebya pacifica]|uniref:High-affnity carbon uptake protein Hat/HatR n=1 Tax=Euzebya pacifica TaxID=1608957 RepID=A0A346Y2I6_9ACTN|nr:High-affnity carbon uptake protein Hat/HatR [Euzebya pacifica]